MYKKNEYILLLFLTKGWVETYVVMKVAGRRRKLVLSGGKELITGG
jgi:hypothetical protein